MRPPSSPFLPRNPTQSRDPKKKGPSHVSRQNCSVTKTQLPRGAGLYSISVGVFRKEKGASFIKSEQVRPLINGCRGDAGARGGVSRVLHEPGGELNLIKLRREYFGG